MPVTATPNEWAATHCRDGAIIRILSTNDGRCNAWCEACNEHFRFRARPDEAQLDAARHARRIHQGAL